MGKTNASWMNEGQSDIKYGSSEVLAQKHCLNQKNGCIKRWTLQLSLSSQGGHVRATFARRGVTLFICMQTISGEFQSDKQTECSIIRTKFCYEASYPVNIFVGIALSLSACEIFMQN